MKTKSILITFVAVVFSGVPAFADCPSADLTGDCKVNFDDFAIMASQWLDAGEPLPVLNGMTWVSINDPGVVGNEPFNGEMSKYETTNAQYCQPDTPPKRPFGMQTVSYGNEGIVLQRKETYAHQLPLCMCRWKG